MNIFKILLLISLGLITACQEKPKYQEIKEELSKSVAELQTEIAKSYQETQKEVENLANEEIEKFHSIEYHVFELKKEQSTLEHEKKLNEIGKDRWDCFFIGESDEFYRFYCRRIPKSYLRYMTRLRSFIP